MAAAARELQFWVADAFTAVPYSGNPAAVCCLGDDISGDISDGLKQAIAREQSYPETAFVTLPPGVSGGLDAFKSGDRFGLRWFTPTAEVPLCGHATLATAHVLFNELGNASAALHFETLSGTLTVLRRPAPGGGGEVLEMALPYSPPADALPPCAGGGAPGPSEFDAAAAHPGLAALVKACTGQLGAKRVGFVKGMDYFLFELPDGATRAQLEGIEPDFSAMTSLVPPGAARGVIVTARGGGSDGYDFYCRFFGPWVAIPEDPVTGSAYCVQGPHWAAALGKTEFRARQCSPRGGDVYVRVDEGARRVYVSGQGVTTMRGVLLLPAAAAW